MRPNRHEGETQPGRAKSGDRILRAFYLDREELAALMAESLRRKLDRRKGADLSALVREAIRKVYGGSES